MTGTQDLPTISIITPCLNSGKFIEECIQSVLSQDYPNLEYVIIDGGSKDNTVDLIRKYESRLSYWISEPDTGQSNAINKGASKCTGALLNWLNADDILLPGALHAIAAAYRPGVQNQIVATPVRNLELPSGRTWLVQQNLLDPVRFWQHNPEFYHQPGIFLSRSLWETTQGVDESLEICMDYDLYCKVAPSAHVVHCNFVAVEFRVHEEAKTRMRPDLFILERTQASRRYWERDKLTKADSDTHDEKVARSVARFVASKKLSLPATIRSIASMCSKLNIPAWLSISIFAREQLKRFLVGIGLR